MKNLDDSNPGSPVPVEHEEGFAPRLNDISKKFIADCLAEKERIGTEYPLSLMLIDEAIDRVQCTGRVPGRDMHANVFKQKPMKISQKVFVPVKQFPKFNFNGKILGPKGNSLRRLQEETMCKICIKGRNSMRGTAREEELRQSGDPRHAHLHKDLYVEISTVAPPAEAYARVAYALAEIRKYLIPDKNDEVSQSQLKEILSDPETAHKAAQFAARVNGRSSIRGSRNNSNTVSILQKITGQSYEQQDDMNDEEDDDEHEPERNHNQDYETKNRSYSSFTPMRQTSQRTPQKRPPPQQQTQQPQQQRYQKRPRESTGTTSSKSSPFAFFQKYQ